MHSHSITSLLFEKVMNILFLTMFDVLSDL